MKKITLKIVDWGKETEKTISSPDEIWNIGGPSATIILPDGGIFSKCDNEMNDITYLIYDAITRQMKE